MNDLVPVNPVAMTVFIAFFVLVTVIGFFAARWKRGDMTQLHEWGLGGRQFGTIISWFLVGGDFYTAYTVIAVPALVYAVGAYGFFALPYTIIVYPFVFAVMPILWKVAYANGHVTAADVVLGKYGSRGLELAVAVRNGVPIAALQLAFAPRPDRRLPALLGVSLPFEHAGPNQVFIEAVLARSEGRNPHLIDLHEFGA